MSSTVNARDLDPGDKSWLKREERDRTERRATPSEAFRRHFGPEHGVELPRAARYGYRPVEFTETPVSGR